jgi:hypothetical protein
MRRIITSFLFVCVLFGVCKAQEGTGSFTCFADGKQFDFKITRELLDNSPDWLDGQENPPLSARRALEIATAYLPKLVSHPEDWEAAEIQLTPHVNKKWVYFVRFSEKKEGLQSIFGIPVLMSGEAIEPSIKKLKSASE